MLMPYGKYGSKNIDVLSIRLGTVYTIAHYTVFPRYYQTFNIYLDEVCSRLFFFK